MLFPLLSIFLLFICLRSFLLFCSFHLLYSVDSSNNNNFPCSCSWCIDSFSTIFFYLYVFFHYHTPRSKMAYSIHVCVCMLASACEWMCLYAKTQAIKISPIYLFYSFGSFSFSYSHCLVGWLVVVVVDASTSATAAGCFLWWFFTFRSLSNQNLYTRCSWANIHKRTRTLKFCHRKKRTKQVNVAATTTNIKIDRTPKIHSHNF